MKENSIRTLCKMKGGGNHAPPFLRGGMKLIHYHTQWAPIRCYVSGSKLIDKFPTLSICKMTKRMINAFFILCILHARGMYHGMRTLQI